MTVSSRAEHLTFKGNLKNTRYGWLRLTPAYSVHLVTELLAGQETEEITLLDPFCGTGTTSLVCAERGIRSDTTDINPFLLWLTETKARAYEAADIALFELAATDVAAVMSAHEEQRFWVPPLHQIEKWWDERTLLQLSRAMNHLQHLADTLPVTVSDLLKITFCRTMIQRANVSFSHQSMSFKKQQEYTLLLLELMPDPISETWAHSVSMIAAAAHSPIVQPPRAIYCDARRLSETLIPETYSLVITSPPYPNRMSYIRELRPYMYWLSYLRDGRQAGELDWDAIGGTWGVATSNLNKWLPDVDVAVPYGDFENILERIAATSPLLSRYVQKYFTDMVRHVEEIYKVVRSGGSIHYIVGNSKFYDVMLPVEQIFAALFRHAGFERVQVRMIRKRTSKKELFEFVVSGQKL